jgi:hypothetical protein
VIHNGRLMGIVEDPDSVTEEQMGLMMAGTCLEEFSPPSGDGSLGQEKEVTPLHEVQDSTEKKVQDGGVL